MFRSFVLISILASLALGLQACGITPSPQDSCNFVQNGDQQRVSWGSSTPVVLYVDSTVPDTYFDAIKAAADIWNKAAGREVLKIGGWTNREGGGGPDGVNLIYFQRNWDGDRAEQARTTIYWAGDRIYEADVKVNDRDFQFTGGDTPEVGKLDMESLLIHEFGHVLGLKHMTVPQSVMQPTLSGATISNIHAGMRRDLVADDQKSIRCEY
jgi:hypothetical protein